jgi:hypothetical protein
MGQARLSTIALVLALSGVVGCASPGPRLESPVVLTNAPPSPSELGEQVRSARDSGVGLLSPRRLARAAAAAERAQFLEGEPRARALSEAKAWLDSAESAAVRGRELLGDVLEARALARRISRRVSEPALRVAVARDFDRAEASFRELVDMLENEELARLARGKARVVRAYLDCERHVRLPKSLEGARRALAEAEAVGADKRFPELFEQARDRLLAAETFTRDHPGAYNETPRRQREADFYARRLLALARMGTALTAEPVSE